MQHSKEGTRVVPYASSTEKGSFQEHIDNLKAMNSLAPYPYSSQLSP